MSPNKRSHQRDIMNLTIVQAPVPTGARFLSGTHLLIKRHASYNSGHFLYMTLLPTVQSFDFWGIPSSSQRIMFQDARCNYTKEDFAMTYNYNISLCRRYLDFFIPLVYPLQDPADSGM